MDELKERFEQALLILRPENNGATYEEKLKAIESLQEIFSILYE